MAIATSTALLVSALAGIGTEVTKSAIEGRAAKSAANTQARYGQQAIDALRQIWGINQQNLAPFIAQGAVGNAGVNSLLGGKFNPFTFSGTPANPFTGSPQAFTPGPPVVPTPPLTLTPPTVGPFPSAGVGPRPPQPPGIPNPRPSIPNIWGL